MLPGVTLAKVYNWLAANPGAIAQFNHPDPGYGGTFDDFVLHPAASSVVFMQEIGNNAQGYVTYETAFIQSNMVGWHVAPTNNSDSPPTNGPSSHSAKTRFTSSTFFNVT